MSVAEVAVIDLETTGLYNSDRIVEIGLVRVGSDGRTLSEYTTLVNPLRDVGPTHIHGITASMVSQAPAFAEVAATLAEHLDGAVMAAHNVSFDARMLVNELDRVGARWDLGVPICTMSWASASFDAVRSLASCCEAAAIENPNAHSALDDARAAAALLVECRTRNPGFDATAAPVRAVAEIGWPRVPRTWRRTDQFIPPGGYLARLVAGVRAGSAVDQSYLALVDHVLADLEITTEESAELASLAAELGYNEARCRQLHDEYMTALVTAAERDSVVTDREAEALIKAARALGTDPDAVLARIADSRPPDTTAVTSLAGKRLCFTGDWDGTYRDEPWSRSLGKELAREAGATPVRSVTKRTDVLVAADPESMSGKAAKARHYKLPILSVPEFLELVTRSAAG